MKSFHQSIPCGIALTLLFFLCGLLVVSAASFEVKGTITITRTIEGQQTTLNDWFIATVSENTNRIRTGAMGNSEMTYLESGTLVDGSYVLIMFDTNRTVTEYNQVENGHVTTIKLKTPIKPINDAMLTLNKDSIPNKGPGILTAVWLAYASGSQFKAQGIGLSSQSPPLFPLAADYAKLGGLARTEYSVNPTPPHLLESLVQWLDPKTYEHINLSPLFQGIFTNTTHEVLTWTNVEALLVPQRFKTINYTANGDRIVFEGIATNIIANVEPLSGMVVPKTTRVVERRFGDGALFPSEFAYTTTNGNLWTKEKLLEHTNALRNVIHNGAEPPGQQLNVKNHAPIVRAIILTLLFLPIAIVIWQRKRNN
jgi:hypothetical protein